MYSLMLMYINKIDLNMLNITGSTLLPPSLISLIENNPEDGYIIVGGFLMFMLALKCIHRFKGNIEFCKTVNNVTPPSIRAFASKVASSMRGGSCSSNNSVDGSDEDNEEELVLSPHATGTSGEDSPTLSDEYVDDMDVLCTNSTLPPPPPTHPPKLRRSPRINSIEGIFSHGELAAINKHASEIIGKL